MAVTCNSQHCRFGTKRCKRGLKVASCKPGRRGNFLSGDPEKAPELLRDLLARHPLVAFQHYLAMCLSALGRHESARDLLTADVEKVAGIDLDISYWAASAYVMEYQHDEAFKWLEKSIRMGNKNRPWFESNPVWEPLRRTVQRLCSSLVSCGGATIEPSKAIRGSSTFTSSCSS